MRAGYPLAQAIYRCELSHDQLTDILSDGPADWQAAVADELLMREDTPSAALIVVHDRAPAMQRATALLVLTCRRQNAAAGRAAHA